MAIESLPENILKPALDSPVGPSVVGADDEVRPPIQREWPLLADLLT
jgi:hypothetical protein